MTSAEVHCPFCGAKKIAGCLCLECSRMAGAILKVGGHHQWRLLSEHRDFDDAFKAAGELFDGGMEEDFFIDDNPKSDADWTGVLIPCYKMVKEKCPECGNDTRVFDLVRTTDYHGIPYRRVCMKCYEHIMETKGYDGEKYDEVDENLDYDY